MAYYVVHPIRVRAVLVVSVAPDPNTIEYEAFELVNGSKPQRSDGCDGWVPLDILCETYYFMHVCFARSGAMTRRSCTRVFRATVFGTSKRRQDDDCGGWMPQQRYN